MRAGAALKDNPIDPYVPCCLSSSKNAQKAATEARVHVMGLFATTSACDGALGTEDVSRRIPEVAWCHGMVPRTGMIQAQRLYGDFQEISSLLGRKIVSDDE